MIETVKIQGTGYLVNGTKAVPNATGNKDFQAVKEWIAEGNTPEPEFTEEELAEQEQAKVNAEAFAYLASTDWKVIRAAETGVEVDAEILTKRKEARDSIV